MAWIGPAIGAGASIIGGAMNSASAGATNEAMLQVNRENRDWMQQMSNTAEQRHVADLKLAGLNPGLAYGTPAPVPGNPGTPSLTAPQPGQGLINSASALSQVGVQMAQKESLEASAQSARLDAAIKAAQLPYSADTAKQSLENMQFTGKEIWNRAANLEQDYATKGTSLEMLNRDANFQEQFLKLKTMINELDVKRASLGLPKLENDASWQQAHPVLSGWLQSGAADLGVNAAGKVLQAAPIGRTSTVIKRFGGAVP